jgi:endonuclease/exonuclease/phosphatase family metal-dependent hydrolase
MKKKILVNLIALMYVGMISAFTSCGKSDKNDPPEEHKTTSIEMKVMSFNIRCYTTSDTGDNSWDSRKEACIRMIEDQVPDIIGFQEPRDNQRDYLITSLPDYNFYYIYAQDGVSSTQTGHTLMAYRKDRFKVVKSGRFWLSDTPDIPSYPWAVATDRSLRTCIWEALTEKESGRTIYFFNTHFPYKTVDNEARKLAANLCISKMKSIAGADAKLFFTGDMNSSHHEEDSRRSSLDALYAWMTDGRDNAAASDNYSSYNGYDDSANSSVIKQIDHIFIRNMTPMVFKTVNAHNYGVTYISDHYPITLTVKAVFE